MDEKKHKLKVLTLEEIAAWKDPVPLFRGLPIYQGTLNLHSGDGGDFKSLTSLEIAKSLLSNNYLLFGKFPPQKDGRVLLIDQENPRPILKKRLLNMGFKEFIQMGLFSIIHRSELKIDDKDWLKIIIDKVIEIDPLFVIFDSLSRIHGRNENLSTGEMSEVMNALRRIVDTTDTCLWCVHHFGKQQEKNSRGSTDIVNAADMEFQNIKQSFNEFIFQPGKKTRVEAFEPILIEVHGLTGLMSNDPISMTYKGTEAEAVELSILRLMKGMGELPVASSKPGISTIQTLLEKNKIISSERTTRDAVNKLVREGRLMANPNGRLPGIRVKVTLYSLPGESEGQNEWQQEDLFPPQGS